MTISPTNSHRSDAHLHPHHSHQRTTRTSDQSSPLDPTRLINLLQTDPQQYEQLLSKLLLQPRQQRQDYVDSPLKSAPAGEYVERTDSEVGNRQDHGSSLPPHQTTWQPNNTSPQRSGSGGHPHAPSYRNTQNGRRQGGRQRQSALQPRSLGLRHSLVQYLVAGGCILSALALMTDVHSLIPTASTVDFCQQVVQPEALLSRDHLVKLLAVSERSPKSSVQQVIAEPYCQLSSLELRAGVDAERDAYPLAFDPDTWLVVLYEGGEYAGFDFSFRK